jgi:hypothetical protein
MKRLLRFGITNRPMTTKRPMKRAIIEEIGAPLPHGAPHDRPMGRPKRPPQVLTSPTKDCKPLPRLTKRNRGAEVGHVAVQYGFLM